VAYRLKPDRALASELKHIVDKQLACAIDNLHATGDPRSDAAVHKARRHIKKVFAAISLVRKPLGDAYWPFNERMRQAHRQLGSIADSESAVETLKRLRNRVTSHADDHLLASLEAALVERVRRVDRKAAADRVLPAVANTLRAERPRVAAWTLNDHGIRAIAPGLHRSVRRAYKAMGRARTHPTAAHFHAWRCRVKKLWYQMRLLNGCCGDKLTVDTRRFDALDECLGGHHNVILVENILVTEALLPRQPTARCLRLLRRYQHQLQRRAAMLGARAFSEKPTQMVARVERLWRAARDRRVKERRQTWQRAA
jgi:CHAD domain-containing protein